jgi:hypothetical protein
VSKSFDPIPFYRSGRKEYPKANIFSTCCSDMLHRPKGDKSWFCHSCGAAYADRLPLRRIGDSFAL